MQKQTADIVLLVLISSGGLVIFAALIINLLLLGRNRRLKHSNELLAIQSEFEESLAQTKIEVAEQTMNDTARDLHDDVSQMLTFSVLQLNQIDLKTNTDLAEKVISSKEAVQHSLNSIRTITKMLSTDYVSSFGIIPALHSLCERINKTKLIVCNLNVDERIVFESKAKELFLFRILQELSSNTIKHSGASKLSISIENKNEQIHVFYKDNGVGTDLEKQKKSGSFGLGNIKKRADILQATLEIKTAKDAGFQATLTFKNVA